MTSFELWLGMVDEHEHSLSCGSDWRVLPVWVCKFGSLGTNMNYGSYWKLHLVLRSVVRNKFPTRVLQVVACRQERVSWGYHLNM